MSANDPDLQPEAEEVYQVEGDVLTEKPVAVTVTGPVRVQALPTKAMATQNRSVGVLSGQATRVLQADHRRASATLVSVGQNMLVAFNLATASDATRMALWPANVPLTVTGDTDVYVAAATGTTTVSVISSLWATGEDGQA